MVLNPAQAQIATDKHRFRVLVCGRKFGKTTLFLEEMIGAAIFKNDQRVIYIAPTLLDARQLLWDKLLRRLENVIVSKNDTLLEIRVRTTKGGTSDIYLGSWEKVQNYRGLEYDFLLLDEVQEYRNFWVGWQEALRPTLTPRQGTALFAGTPKGFTHFYDLFNLKYTDNDYASFQFPTSANPFIPKDEIVAARRELPEDRFAQEYEAQFRKASGLVFKEFNRELHTYTEQIYGFSERVAGVDFGYRSPAAVVEVCMKDGNYYVSGELYRTGMTELDTAEYVSKERYNKVYPDPESPSGIEEMRRLGVNVRDVKKGKDSIQFGIDKLRELFKQNRLFIHTSCINLISELETYAYPEKSPYRNANETPIDEFNHAIDALRYVVMTHTATKPFVQRPFRDKTIEIWRGR